MNEHAGASDEKKTNRGEATTSAAALTSILANVLDAGSLGVSPTPSSPAVASVALAETLAKAQLSLVHQSLVRQHQPQPPPPAIPALQHSGSQDPSASILRSLGLPHHHQNHNHHLAVAAAAAAGPSSSAPPQPLFIQREKTSAFRGITRRKRRWEAHVWRHGKQAYLGGYRNEVQAARAYDMAVLKIRGKEAETNFPLENYLEELREMNASSLSVEEFIVEMRERAKKKSKQLREEEEDRRIEVLKQMNQGSGHGATLGTILDLHLGRDKGAAAARAKREREVPTMEVGESSGGGGGKAAAEATLDKYLAEKALTTPELQTNTLPFALQQMLGSSGSSGSAGGEPRAKSDLDRVLGLALDIEKRQAMEQEVHQQQQLQQSRLLLEMLAQQHHHQQAATQASAPPPQQSPNQQLSIGEILALANAAGLGGGGKEAAVTSSAPNSAKSASTPNLGGAGAFGNQGKMG